jgi:hypothetical protein
MYCQNCGSGLNPQTKYCNRCGTSLVPAGEVRMEKTAAEKRLDEYLDGLFWISVFGLAFVVGGAVLLKKVGFHDGIILAYILLSTTVFLINFGISLWGAVSMMRSKQGKLTMQPGHDTRELTPPKIEPVMMPAGSVIENTTRSLPDPILSHKKAQN